MEMNDEASIWDEWEDWRDGDMDDPKNKEQYPEGFVYPCCGKDGNADGCMVGRHVSRTGAILAESA
jgi:hypothetical protein